MSNMNVRPEGTSMGVGRRTSVHSGHTEPVAFWLCWCNPFVVWRVSLVSAVEERSNSLFSTLTMRARHVASGMAPTEKETDFCSLFVKKREGRTPSRKGRSPLFLKRGGEHMKKL